MGLKIFAIAITLFLAEIVFITTKDFKNSTPLEENFNFTDIAFENIDGYLITEDGVDSNIKASKFMKYKTYAKAFDVKTDFKKDTRRYQVDANSALLKDNIIELEGNVHYINREKYMDVKSQHLIYNTKSEIVQSKTPFVLKTLTATATGENFEYDQKNGKIKANKLNYKSIQ